jgi:HEAT repeat protein
MGMWLLAAAVTGAAPSLSPGEAAALGKRAVALISEYSQMDDADARALAASAWGQIGNKAALPVLRKALKDKNVIVRIEAATSLQKLGESQRAGLALEALILKAPAQGDATPEDEMRRVARDKARAKAISRLSEFGGEDAVALFEKTLEDPSQIVREATSIALARMGLEEFAAPFVQALRDEDAGLRAQAARSLGEIGRLEYLPAVKEAATDSSASVREAAMTALAGFEGFGAAPTMAEGLKDEDPRVRAAALASLAKVPDPDTTAALRETLAEAKAPEAALKAQAGLARRGHSVDLGLASRTLEAKDSDLKALALEVMKEAPGDEASLLLKRAMDGQTDPRLKLGAAAALVRRLQRRRA